MKRNRKLVLTAFLPYRIAKLQSAPIGEKWIDVSSSAEWPYCQLSPFYAHGEIPVPGMPGRVSDSVEGIWQGLKVIRGRIAPRYFVGSGQKRGGKPMGHQYGDQKRLLKLVEAREKVYCVAYLWMLENKVDAEIIDELVAAANRGIRLSFYDREDNGSIHKDQPLAHAKLLSNFINHRCQKLVKYPKR